MYLIFSLSNLESICASSKKFFSLDVLVTTFVTVHLKMSDFLSNSSLFQIIQIGDKSVKLIVWDGFYSISLISFVLICGTVCLTSRILVVNYIYRYAPKDRPINTMTLMEQVSKLFIVICKCYRMYFS